MTTELKYETRTRMVSSETLFFDRLLIINVIAFLVAIGGNWFACTSLTNIHTEILSLKVSGVLVIIGSTFFCALGFSRYDYRKETYRVEFVKPQPNEQPREFIIDKDRIVSFDAERILWGVLFGVIFNNLNTYQVYPTVTLLTTVLIDTSLLFSWIIGWVLLLGNKPKYLSPFWQIVLLLILQIIICGIIFLFRIYRP